MTGKNSTEPPILLGGYMHSGTSVLMRILSNAPEVYCRRWETRFFSYLPETRKRFSQLSDDEVFRNYISHLIYLIWNGPNLGGVRHLKGEVHEVSEETVDEILNLISHDENHAVVYRRVFDALTIRAGASRWLEKTPSNIFHVDQILESIPDAFIVNIVRDPRDIVASKKIRRQRALADTELPPEIRKERQLAVGYDPFLDSLAWKSAARAGRLAARSYPDQVIVIRYEDFVSEPAFSIRRVCDFLGLPFDQEMLEVSAYGSAEGGRGNVKAPGIQKDRTERWQRTLTKPEIFACQFVTSSEMTKAGYTTERIGIMNIAKVPILAVRSGIDLLRRLFRKYKLGGLAYIGNVVASWVRRARMLIKD